MLEAGLEANVLQACVPLSSINFLPCFDCFAERSDAKDLGTFYKPFIENFKTWQNASLSCKYFSTSYGLMLMGSMRKL